jgi:hypothetical protein
MIFPVSKASCSVATTKNIISLESPESTCVFVQVTVSLVATRLHAAANWMLNAQPRAAQSQRARSRGFQLIDVSCLNYGASRSPVWRYLTPSSATIAERPLTSVKSRRKVSSRPEMHPIRCKTTPEPHVGRTLGPRPQQFVVDPVNVLLLNFCFCLN